ncbi:MAG: bifunctional 5,10-methylenetetrahydrofolate dehydrogenase/5,10-methenyltetrahydrofolate cyclohydrolase [Firmicutes bacterium]|nr:bifunctional 5,10-methylenetetrahydrofolate dehydrogenase/5,10-methenyltetrahydrofolate cyclohydrolase [Bacillota bacterium]
MGQILQGKPVALALSQQLKERVADMRRQGKTPRLAIVRLGEAPDDIAYEKSAIKCCRDHEVDVQSIVLPAGTGEEQLLAHLQAVNDDKQTDGCLLLKPLPPGIRESKAAEALAPQKDVDGITPGSLAHLCGLDIAGFPPCTAQACLEILDHYQIDAAGKRAVIIGRSLVVGKPLAMLLLARNATVTVCHSKTKDLPAVVREADIVVAAMGRARLLGAEYFRPGQIVLDVGINFDDQGKMCGDVDFAQVEPIVAAITPVPGGVGAVTNRVLLKHVVDAAQRVLG